MLLDRFKNKVVTLEALCERVGARPRAQKVVLCHGVFDVPHQGHLTHWLDAKSKADVLVVSITSDQYVTKGIYRPHVPERLRALHLANFEIIDYVVIDDNPSPVPLLNRLQPDYYAKGFEYKTELRPKFRAIEEISTVRDYGGEVIFTSGDYVDSSSLIITTMPPDLRYEKLAMVMQDAGLSWSQLYDALDAASVMHIHIVGDMIVDSLTYGSVIGGFTKTPTPSVLFERQLDYVGGAGVVAKHFDAAGAVVKLTTVTGDDPLALFVLKDLASTGIELDHHVDPTRPTTHKNAIVDVPTNYRMMKLDKVSNRPISDLLKNQIAQSIGDGVSPHAVVFADFRHGIFNKRTIPRFSQAIPADAFSVADSQVASRWGNITDFKEFDLVTPNLREAQFALGDQDLGVRSLAEEVYKATQAVSVVLKLGAHGVITWEGPTKTYSIDSFAEQVVDPVGSGDAFLAYAVLGRLATKSMAAGAILGTMAAAVECEMNGNIPVAVDDVREKLRKVEEATK